MQLTYTTLTKALCRPVAELIAICFPDMPPSDQYSEEDLLQMADIFPAGTIVVLNDDQVIGMGTGIFTNIDFDNLPPTEHEILYTADGENLHDDDGDFYYGSDIAVHPDYRGRGIAREIYNRRKALVINLDRKGFVAAGVLPGYAKYKQEMPVEEFVERVMAGDIFDPTLSVQLRNEFQVVRLLKDYFIYPASDNWSALIVWKNPHL